MAYLDKLDNHPRHKISSGVMQFVIIILKQCVVPDTIVQKSPHTREELAKCHEVK